MTGEAEVVFECRPRGWPPGWRWRVVPLLLLLSPLLVGWVNLALTGARLRDHDPTWAVTWTQLSVRVMDEGVPVTAHARGPLWGLTHPLLPDVVVPWVLVAGLAAGAFEAVRLARYRSRRVCVARSAGDPPRLRVSAGLLRARSRELLPGPGSARLIDAPAGAVLTCEAPRRPGGPPRPTSIPLGRLDPLDLADLTRALGAPTPVLHAAGRRWWPFVMAIIAAISTPALLLAVAPWRATLQVSLFQQRWGQDVVLLELDGPAWGRLRSPVTPWSYAEKTRAGGRVTFRNSPGWLSRVALDGQPAREDAQLRDLAESLGLTELTERLDDRLLRRRDARTASLAVLDGRGWRRAWHGEAQPVPVAARRPVRVTGLVLFVEGPPLAFDVTLTPDAPSVTLDLAGLLR